MHEDLMADYVKEIDALRAENVRLRAAVTDLINEYPTRSDAMAKAAQVLDELLVWKAKHR